MNTATVQTAEVNADHILRFGMRKKVFIQASRIHYLIYHTLHRVMHAIHSNTC